MTARLPGMLAVLGMAVIVAGCTGGQPGGHPRIQANETVTWAGTSTPAWRADVPHPLVGAIGVCLDRPGTIEVIDVTMEHIEGDFRVDAYAFRQKHPHANHPSPVTHTETLWELGFDESSTTIDTVCDEELGGPSDADLAGVTGPVNRGVTDVGIQFSKATDSTARGAIIRLTYRSGDETHVHRIGFELILCEHDHQATHVPECDFKDYEWP
jgi:hypothetical protein